MPNSTTNSPEIVFVGLSGGVDSSVSAKRLIAQGYTVIGVFIKTWQPSFITCNWEKERLDAMRVAAQLGISFYTCDAEAAYRDGVAEYMIKEYKEGRTPNPDTMCNKEVKFGSFLNYALSHGATKIATGHYAQVKYFEGRFHLLRGVDQSKDQSYFLWTLTQEQLSKTLFPVGDTLKSTIRKEANDNDLITKAKPDSQGICFLGDIDIPEFLSHFVHTESGSVLNEDGKIIGTHNGAIHYTIGQRHGLTIHTKENSQVPQYVIQKDVAKNTIVVATKPKLVTNEEIILTKVNLIQGQLPKECEAQFRYHQKPFKVSISKQSNDSISLLVLDKNIELPSAGQSCVFYSGLECLGGGSIEHIVQK